MEVERRLSVSQKRKERKKGRKFCFIFENSPSSSLLLFQTEFSNLFFFLEKYIFSSSSGNESVCVFCVVLCAFTGFCCSAALLACFLSSRRSAFVCIYTGEEGEERGRGKKCSTFPHSTEL